MASTVKLATARELVEAGSVRHATLLGQKGGYFILLRVGMAEKTLATKLGAPRLFAQLDRAAHLLRDQLGIARFEVDASGYAPSDIISSRPDRAEHMRETHAAAAHDRWFRQQVEVALANPAPEWIEHDALFDELETETARLAESRNA